MSFLKANFWFRIRIQTNGNIQTWQSVLFSESFSTGENTFVPSSRIENNFILNNLRMDRDKESKMKPFIFFCGFSFHITLKHILVFESSLNFGGEYWPWDWLDDSVIWRFYINAHQSFAWHHYSLLYSFYRKWDIITALASLITSLCEVKWNPVKSTGKW